MARRPFVAACRLLSSCGAQAPKRAGSVVVAHGLSCPVACGILVPRPGIEPVSPALQDGFLTTGPPGKSLNYQFCRTKENGKLYHWKCNQRNLK